MNRNTPSFRRLCAAASLLLATLHLSPLAAAAASRHGSAARADVVADFHALAQQTPWACAPTSAAPGPVSPDGAAACAWQNRLRMQRWSWSDDASTTCLSTQAHWWSWAQSGLPPAAPRSVWDRRWNVRVLHMSLADEQRVLVLRRDGANRWQATEWRWNPNPRPATRRWQERRWKLLLEATAQPQEKIPAVDTDTARMRPVFARVLGARPGELGADGMALEPAGVCLHASYPLPGQPKLSLSYNPSDSRLEQRAAMHLQLSRQYPNARWLTQFTMLPAPANPQTGAKFLATWIEGSQLNSQLWMPTKGDTATVRVRITAPLPRGQDRGAAAARVKQIVEHELAAIAVQWAAAYE